MAELQLDEMNALHFDVLKEIANIGAGNATTALSKMLNAKVDMKVPCIQFMEFKELAEGIGGAENLVVGILLTLDTDGSTYPDNPHEGEEFGYVLNGTVTLHLGNKQYKIKKGESFYFKPDRQHYIAAAGKMGAALLWVTTPPSF